MRSNSVMMDNPNYDPTDPTSPAKVKALFNPENKITALSDLIDPATHKPNPNCKWGDVYHDTTA